MITPTQQKQVDARVERGIKWLNKTVPNWHKKITITKLKMANSSTCICGQVFGHFREAELSGGEALTRGFDVSSSAWYVNSGEYYNALEVTWKNRIREIRKALKK